MHEQHSDDETRDSFYYHNDKQKIRTIFDDEQDCRF